jgi:Family of unknown function (DUF6134)
VSAIDLVDIPWRIAPESIVPMKWAPVAAATIWMLLDPTLAWSDGESTPRLIAAIPSAGRWDYDVIRSTEKIGEHSVTFRRQGDLLTVATRTNISIEVLGITLFRYHYDAREEWVDGRLVRLTSRTDDDGEDLDVDLAVTNGRLRGTCNGTALDLPASILPVAVWHPDIIRRSVLLDQYKCVERRVQISDRGVEAIVAKGQALQTQHYTMTGQLERDLWYGPDGQTVQVQFPAKDGSEITFVLLRSSEPLKIQ